MDELGARPPELPPLPESPVSFPGPFSSHDVVVNGWRVPLLQAQVHDGGMLTLVLDRRFMLELSVADAQSVVPFLADAIAVALGYQAHPSADDDPANLPHLPHPRPQRVLAVADMDVGERPD